MQNERQILVTPFGAARYPRLNTPDTQFKPEGEFRSDILVDPDDPQVVDFIAKIDAIYQANIEERVKVEKIPLKKLKLGSKPYKMETDKEGNETGRLQIRASMMAHVETKSGKSWDQRPTLLDGKKQPISAAIGGNSVIRMVVEPNPWYTAALGAGVSLRLKTVQVKELVSPTTRDGSEMLDEVDGYTDEAGLVAASGVESGPDDPAAASF
jgi:hypothetical protein